MTQQNNIKWVKASERLPEKEGDLFPIRYGINFQTLSTGYYEQGHWYLAHNHAKLFLRNQLEWLEELPVSSPAQSAEEAAIDQIVGILYKNKTDEADEGSWIEGKDFHKVATEIYKGLASPEPSEREGKAEENRNTKQL